MLRCAMQRNEERETKQKTNNPRKFLLANFCESLLHNYMVFQDKRAEQFLVASTFLYISSNATCLDLSRTQQSCITISTVSLLVILQCIAIQNKQNRSANFLCEFFSGFLVRKTFCFVSMPGLSRFPCSSSNSRWRFCRCTSLKSSVKQGGHASLHRRKTNVAIFFSFQ